MCYRVIRHLIEGIAAVDDHRMTKSQEVAAMNLLSDQLTLFDEILQSEWEPNPDGIQIDQPGTPDIACDFCGADIFQSFFECTECASPQSTDEPAYILCAACYTEGRSCTCRTMAPKIRRPFVNLLDVRNQAAQLLGSPDYPIFTPNK